MKIQSQVIGIESARTLKQLGVNQDSLFYHREIENRWAISLANSEIDILTGFLEVDTMYDDDGIDEQIFSAFTVAELGVMLPMYCITNYGHTGWDAIKSVRGEDDVMEFCYTTEAEAKCALLINLLNSVYTTVAEVNQRLDNVLQTTKTINRQ